MYNLEQVKKTCKTPSGETGCLGNPYVNGCLSIHFFNSPLPLTQSVRLPMVTYPSLYIPCVTYGALCHAIGHLRLYTLFAYHQKIYIGRFYLSFMIAQICE